MHHAYDTDEMFVPIMVDNLTDPSFKGSAMVNSIVFLMKTIEFRGKHHWKVLDQKVFSFCEGIPFARHHYLYSSFNEKIKQLTAGGFIDYWQAKWTKHRNVTEKPPEPDPIILNLERLSIGFEIWLIMIGISTMAFLGEIVYFWVPKLYYALIFKQILKSFFKYQN